MSIETKYYADGSSATGPAPLPNVSSSGSPEVSGPPNHTPDAVAIKKSEAEAAQRNATAQAVADEKKAANKVVIPSDFEGRTIDGFTVYHRGSMDVVEIEHADGPTYLKFRHGLHQVGPSIDWDDAGEALEASDKIREYPKPEFPKAMFKGDPTKPEQHLIQTVPDQASENVARKDGFINGAEQTAKYPPVSKKPSIWNK